MKYIVSISTMVFLFGCLNSNEVPLKGFGHIKWQESGESIIKTFNPNKDQILMSLDKGRENEVSSLSLKDDKVPKISGSKPRRVSFFFNNESPAALEFLIITFDQITDNELIAIAKSEWGTPKYDLVLYSHNQLAYLGRQAMANSILSKIGAAKAIDVPTTFDARKLLWKKGNTFISVYWEKKASEDQGEIVLKYDPKNKEFFEKEEETKNYLRNGHAKLL